VFSFSEFLLYDVKLLRMGHETNFKSAVPSHGKNPLNVERPANYSECTLFFAFNMWCHIACQLLLRKPITNIIKTNNISQK